MKAENEELFGIISRYLEGSAGKEETAILESWINESEENKKCYRQITELWQSGNYGEQIKNLDSWSALKKVLKQTGENSVIRKIWTFWGKVAAIILVPLLAASVIWFKFGPGEKSSLNQPVYSEVFATFGTRTALKLVDGTLVWLNSGSSLKYPDRFTGSKREVFLDGEAYFEVVSNPDQPFFVKTCDLTIKATGTRFDVFGYKSDSRSEITLAEGKISVSRNAGDGKSTLLTELSPEQHLIYNKNTNEISVLNEEPYKFYSWKDGKLIFRNEPLADVVNKLSQVFNVEIELQGKSLQDYRYRATFEDESLSEILKLIEISSPVHYREIKRLPLPDGSFPKKKVIIFPAKQ